MQVSFGISRVAGDVRYALRGLLNSKVFSATVILTMALGIGANTAVFSLIDTLLLKTLPVRNAKGLVLLTGQDSGGFRRGTADFGVRENLSWFEFQEIRDRGQSFTDLFAAQNGNDSLRYALGDGPKEKGHGRLVTGNYFAVLGVGAAIGRTFTPEDDRPGHPAPVVVFSNSFWQRRFGGAPDVLGKQIRVGRAELTVIGVTAAGFYGERVGESTEMFMPMQIEPQVQASGSYLKDKEISWLSCMGRLKAGVSLAQAQTATNVLFREILGDERPARVSQEDWKRYLNQRIALRDGSCGVSPMRAQFSNPLLLLMSAVGLVLLIACANVANLLLARATGRSKEVSVRLALGAAPGRLMQQMLTESMLYGALGGFVSLALAQWGSRLLLTLVSQNGVAATLNLELDGRVLTFTLAVALATGLVFGMVPALAARNADVMPALQKSSRSVMEGGSRRLTIPKVLVIAQVALSLLLLAGAGLFVRTLQNLMHTELGYQRDHLLIANLDFASAGYKDQRLANVYRQVYAKLNETPELRVASYSMNGVFSGSEAGNEFAVQDYQAHRSGTDVAFDQVGPRYFETIGIRMLEGRDFTASDDERARKVAIVNQAFAKKFISQGNPIGKWIRGSDPAGPQGTFTIIGVAADAKDHSLRAAVVPRIYVPAMNGMSPPLDFTNIEVRTALDDAHSKLLVQKAIADVDAAIPVVGIRTVDEQVDRQLGTEKLVAQLCLLFGGLALLLAIVGLYGVIAYSVSRRTAEMGVRLALGARGSRVISLVLAETLLLVAGGFAIGIPASIALASVLGNKLYGVLPYDPAALGGAIAVLACAAALAGLIPAVRASRIDPLVALRWE